MNRFVELEDKRGKKITIQKPKICMWKETNKDIKIWMNTTVFYTFSIKNTNRNKELLEGLGVDTQ